jgi:DNA polymerase-3 subunit gamma/tau
MLSTQAWNALLKLIEEPPDSVVFLFCTTDPHKIPGTIMSRVLRVDFKRIDLNLIVKRLAWILEQEQLPPIEESSLKYIAQLANGGMRDAISLLDKVLGYGVEVTQDLINSALGTVGAETSYHLLECILNNDVLQTVNMIDSLSVNNLDYKAWIMDFRRFVVKAVMIMLGADTDQLALPDEVIEKIRQLPKNPKIMLIADLLNHICNALVLESDPLTRIRIEFIKLASDRR